MSGIDDDRDDERASMADRKERSRHRCGWPDYYGCRICTMAADDPDEGATDDDSDG